MRKYIKYKCKLSLLDRVVSNADLFYENCYVFYALLLCPARFSEAELLILENRRDKMREFIKEELEEEYHFDEELPPKDRICTILCIRKSRIETLGGGVYYCLHGPSKFYRTSGNRFA